VLSMFHVKHSPQGLYDKQQNPRPYLLALAVPLVFLPAGPRVYPGHSGDLQPQPTTIYALRHLGTFTTFLPSVKSRMVINPKRNPPIWANQATPSVCE
jgi:hypothetical protein